MTDIIKKLATVRAKYFENEQAISKAFTDIAPIKEEVDAIAMISEEGLASIPTVPRSEIIDGLTRWLEPALKVVSFDPYAGGNPQEQVRSIFQEYLRNRSFLSKAMTTYRAWIPSLPTIESAVALENQIKSVLQEVIEEKQKASAAAASAQKAAGLTGANTFVEIFQSEASRFSSLSKWWLTGFFSAFVIAGIYLFCAYSQLILAPPADVTIFEQLILKAPTISVFILIVYILQFLSKNYQAAAHNEAVNRHRANAMQTYGTFLDSTSNNAEREIILHKVTSAIFDHQRTGYMFRENQNASNSSMDNLSRMVSK